MCVLVRYKNGDKDHTLSKKIKMKKIVLMAMLTIGVTAYSGIPIKKETIMGFTISDVSIKYAQSFGKEKYDQMYEIVKENFPDLPISNRKYIRYQKKEDHFELCITIKRRKIKVAYRSIRQDEASELIVDKVNKIKEQIGKL